MHGFNNLFEFLFGAAAVLVLLAIGGIYLVVRWFRSRK